MVVVSTAWIGQSRQADHRFWFSDDVPAHLRCINARSVSPIPPREEIWFGFMLIQSPLFSPLCHMIADWVGTEAVDATSSLAHETAFNEFRDYLSSGGKPSIFAINHLLEMCEKRGDGASAEWLQAAMTSNHIKPSYHTYYYLIGAYGRAGWLGHMQEMLDRMLASDVVPDVAIISAMVLHYGRANDIEGIIIMSRWASISAHDMRRRCHASLRPAAGAGAQARQQAEQHSGASLQDGPAQCRLECQIMDHCYMCLYRMSIKNAAVNLSMYTYNG